MKKINCFTKAFMLIALMMSAIVINAQRPEYKVFLKNDTLSGPNLYEFEVWDIDSVASPAQVFYMSNRAEAIQIANAFNGILTGAPVASASILMTYMGGSTLPASLQPPGAWDSKNAISPHFYIRVNGAPAAADPAPQCPTWPGWKVGRFSISRTDGPNFTAGFRPNFTKWNAPPINQSMFARWPTNTLPSPSASIVNQAPNSPWAISYDYSTYMHNPIVGVFPVAKDITCPGNGSYPCGNPRPDITLAGSEDPEIIYELYYEGAYVTGSGKKGTFGVGGADLVWTPTADGDYQVRAYRDGTYMTQFMNQTFTVEEGPCSPTVDRTEDSLNFSSVELHWGIGPNFFPPTSVKYRVWWKRAGFDADSADVLDPTTSLWIKNLKQNTQYDWKVAASDDGTNFGDYTDIRQFTTLNPVLDFEPGTLSFNRAKFRWTGIKYAWQYQLNYFTNGVWKCANLFAGAEPQSDSSYICQTLGTNNRVLFKVRFWDITTHTLGDQWTDTVGIQMPPPPVCSVTEIQNNQAKVHWTPVPNAIKYHVRVYATDNPVTEKTVGPYYYTADTFMVVNSLQPGTQYWWRVMPDYGAYTYTTFAPMETFTTVAAPVTTTLPCNFNKTTIRWDSVPGAVAYRLKMGGSVTGILNASTPGFIPATPYYTTYHYENLLVKCSLIVDYGSGFTSMYKLYDFVTPKPDLIPTPGTFSTDLTWNINGTGNASSPYNIRYRLVGSPIWTYQSGVSGTFTSLNTLLPSSNYEWQVSPFYGPGLYPAPAVAGYSPYSVSDTFRTNDPKMANVMSMVNNEATGEIYIYPNPAKDRVAVNFDCSASGESVISMMDVTGKKVYSETFGSVEGNNSYIINLNGLSMGVYLMEVKNGEFTQTKKIVVQ